MTADPHQSSASATFGLLLKSYAPDLPYATRLIASFEQYNTDHLHLYLLVPDADLPQFAALASADVTVMSEDALAAHLTDEPIHGWAPGYLNQQVVKLSFWELGLTTNYLCMDSDAVFVRPFGRNDFMATEDEPCTFLTRDAGLISDPEYWSTHWQVRDARLREIRQILDLPQGEYLTCHQHAVFSGLVLRAWRDRFLAPRGWTYLDALAASPYEFSWYNFWLEKDRTIPVHAREPIFKTFHGPSDHLDYAIRGIHAADIARGYVGAVLNSNFTRGAGVLSIDDDLPQTLAAYVPVTTLLKAAGRRALGRPG